MTNKISIVNQDFTEVVQLISAARQHAYRSVNTALIELYWQIGAYISRKIKAAEWGDGVIAELARFLAITQPGLKGFTRPNLFRMRQFYETYQENLIVSALLRQLPWTHNLIILSQSKRPEEREFYLRMAINEKWSSRELERQFKTALFERTVPNPAKVSPALTQQYPEALNVFKDSYVVDFLNLPSTHSESDLHRGLIQKLKHFLLELGRDFCFLGSEFPIQVGKQDFALDLLFFHRGLNALVAIELKVDRFEPEQLGKLNFYLEALDRDHKKPHENPAIGVLLCASKDDEGDCPRAIRVSNLLTLLWQADEPVQFDSVRYQVITEMQPYSRTRKSEPKNSLPLDFPITILERIRLNFACQLFHERSI